MIRLYVIAGVIAMLLGAAWWAVDAIQEAERLRSDAESMSATINGQQAAIEAQAADAARRNAAAELSAKRAARIAAKLSEMRTKLEELPADEEQRHCDSVLLPDGYADGLREYANSLQSGKDAAAGGVPATNSD